MTSKEHLSKNKANVSKPAVLWTVEIIAGITPHHVTHVGDEVHGVASRDVRQCAQNLSVLALAGRPVIVRRGDGLQERENLVPVQPPWVQPVLCEDDDFSSLQKQRTVLLHRHSNWISRQ